MRRLIDNCVGEIRLAALIATIVQNLPAILFVAALVTGYLRRGNSLSHSLLEWLLLLSVGVDSLWAGFFHIAFPQVAASAIGWQVSPFQFEIGVADAAAGVVAVLSFWRSFAFKAAIALYAVLFYIGVAYGHFHQALANGDYSPDNFGLLLVVTLLHIVMLPWLLWKASREPQV